ncbi:hypothetical protein EKK58_01970 [Candidatus Dependentiae bacterium]|nr:MAG: hypothetical protein EKK58_01970 [Candidatus Dependentiae bacterium]
MKNTYGIALYLFFSMHISFCMEDMARYYEDFEKYTIEVQKIYQESKNLPEDADRLQIASLVLDFYEAQKEKSAYADHAFFFKQFESLKEASEKIKKHNTNKSNSLNNMYFVEDALDEDDIYIKKNDVSVKTIDETNIINEINIINEKIENIFQVNNDISVISKKIHTGINLLNMHSQINFFKNTKLDTKEQNGSLLDKIKYTKELLEAIDKMMVTLKEERTIDDQRITLWSNELRSCTNKFNVAVKAMAQTPIHLNIFDILLPEADFKKICKKAEEDKNCTVIYSWEDFCAWKTKEEKKHTEQKKDNFEDHINEYIRNKIKQFQVQKDAHFNFFREFILQFNVYLVNNEYFEKKYEKFSHYANIIINSHRNTLLLLSEDVQQLCINKLLKSVGFLFVKGIHFIHDIAILPFDELLFLGSVFFDHPQVNSSIMPNGYIMDYINNANSKTINPLELINRHIKTYRELKKNCYPTSEDISLNQKTVLHVLARILLQDTRIANEDFLLIQKILLESSEKNQHIALASVYGFCKFINQENFEKTVTLLPKTQGQFQSFFAEWHSTFTCNFDSTKTDFKYYYYAAMEKICEKNHFVYKCFRDLLDLPDKELVLANPVVLYSNSKKPNEFLLDYIKNVIKTSEIIKKNNENLMPFFKGARKLWETEESIMNFNKKTPKLPLETILYAYRILMGGLYELSIAFPSILCPKSAELPEFAKKYKQAYNDLNRLQHISDDHKNQLPNKILHFMFINWWEQLYVPTEHETFDDYLTKEKSLLEQAKKINLDKYQVGRECKKTYLIKQSLKVAQKIVAGLQEYYILPSASPEDQKKFKDSRDTYVLKTLEMKQRGESYTLQQIIINNIL